MCLHEHINHDYIYADEIASFEIKQALKATMTECSYKIKSQSMLFNETEKLAQYIDDLKLQEYEKIHYYFMDLHKELDRREKQLKDIYYEQVKDVESILRKDLTILKNRMKEFNEIAEKLNEKSGRFKLSNDLAIVANSHEVFQLQRKVKNNNFEGKRLAIEDEEEGIEESNKFEDSPEIYSYQPKKYFAAKHGEVKENARQKDTLDENNGEHVFFVQLDSELPMPQFIINISKEKKMIEGIGKIKNSFFSNQELIDENQESARSKRASEVEMTPKYRGLKPDLPFVNNQNEIKQFLNNYGGGSAPFFNKSPQNYGKPQVMSYNDKAVEQNYVGPAVTQKVIETEETIVKSDTNSGREMYWFKWDSYD